MNFLPRFVRSAAAACCVLLVLGCCDSGRASSEDAPAILSVPVREPLVAVAPPPAREPAPALAPTASPAQAQAQAPAPATAPVFTPRSISSGSQASLIPLAPDSLRRPSFRQSGGPRLIAIGDLHGDLSATRNALQLAGVMNDEDHWIGGTTLVVQTGDQLDRGDGESAILDLLDRLILEARAAGGAVYVLNGNHETMNASLDFRYVTDGGYEDFARVLGFKEVTGEGGKAARAEAFTPGGVYARRLANRNVMMIVGDSIFVHGGVTPEIVVHGIQLLNMQTANWLMGRRDRPALIGAREGPVWIRKYSDDEQLDCDLLQKTIEMLGLKRMVVGHTVQSQINCACDGKVWRIDVGMAAAYEGPIQVMEITPDEIRVLRRGEDPLLYTTDGVTVTASQESGVSQSPLVVSPFSGQ